MVEFEGYFVLIVPGDEHEGLKDVGKGEEVSGSSDHALPAVTSALGFVR